jgi:hypothetical protein
MRRIRSTCWARAAIDHVAEPTTAPRKSRRLIATPEAEVEASYQLAVAVRKGPADVRFGSKADICAATSDVRFTPNSDRENEIPQKVMSALPLKADMCSALAHVCLGHKRTLMGFGPLAEFWSSTGTMSHSKHC